MHPSVQEFVEKVLTAADVADRRVLEVGAYDVNGSVRPYVESLSPAEYLGVDAEVGPSVDRVVNCEHLCSEVGTGWDVVISTEMLEHVVDWRTCITQMAEAVAENGLLLLTTRSPGFGYHPFPLDCWRFTIPDMERIVASLGLDPIAIADDPQCAGVFVLARKVGVAGSLEHIDVMAMTGA